MDAATLRAAARRLVMESYALEAYRELETAGVGVRVIKGLALEWLLYSDEEPRPYGDIDLLVDPRRWDLAVRTVKRLGYRPTPAGGLHEHPTHSVALRRTLPGGGAVEIDLHHRIHGPRVSSRRVWAAASQDPVTVPVGDLTVLTTNDAVTLFHLAVGALPEFSGGARHAMEFRRFRDQRPDALSKARELAANWKAVNIFERAVAHIDPVGTTEGVPPPLPLRVRSVLLSAWISHMRSAPSLRARLTLIREVAADRRSRS